MIWKRETTRFCRTIRTRTPPSHAISSTAEKIFRISGWSRTRTGLVQIYAASLNSNRATPHRESCLITDPMHVDFEKKFHTHTCIYTCVMMSHRCYIFLIDHASARARQHFPLVGGERKKKTKTRSLFALGLVRARRLSCRLVTKRHFSISFYHTHLFLFNAHLYLYYS